MFTSRSSDILHAATDSCFDYGNSENSVVAHNKSQGAGTMEAIYFGNAHWQGNRGDNSSSDGPWVGADLECGMYVTRLCFVYVFSASMSVPVPLIFAQ